MKRTLRATFGRSTRILRKRAGLTIEELAARAGIHSNYLGEVERGMENISLDNIEKIADGLSVSPSALFPAVETLLQGDTVLPDAGRLLKSLRLNDPEDRKCIIRIARILSRHLAKN